MLPDLNPSTSDSISENSDFFIIRSRSKQ
jgi:hypothetical protein